MSPITSSAVSSQAATATLRAVERSYAQRRTLALLLPTLGLGLLLTVSWLRFPSLRWYVVGLAVIGLGWLLWRIWKLWQPDLAAVAQRLDRRFARLEDSTGLLLRDPAELNLLEQLQQQHVAAHLTELQSTDSPLLPVDFRRPLMVAGLALLAALGIWLVKPRSAAPLASAAPVAVHFSEDQPKGSTSPAAARIVETRILVMPPTYTRRPAFAATQPSFQCPQESRVRWTVRVNRSTGAAPELELGKQRLKLRPVAGQPSLFTAEQTLTASALYRLRFAGRTSDDYAIDVQADQSPVVQIQTPKPYTLVEFGTKPQVPVRVAVRDDYGLTRAQLVATVAQGQGEAVKFKETRTDLSAAVSGKEQATLAHLLNLPKLGLTYGDEVYFYVQAWDNHRHTTRSDTYLVQWEDTTVEESTADISLSVSVVPAYFRSQRQIIIDTEKLIAEGKGLTAEAFADRGNTLGFDQKVLRLRYGKFLGEEFEKSLGETAGPADTDHHEEGKEGGAEEHDEHEHEHSQSGARPSTSPTAATDALMEPYMHRHDDSETADFLEPAVKAKLRGVLAQMWEAELRLRTSRPTEALPYEYRALRLLKQVQQQTRAYVRKSGYEPPPMPEATLRLTGDLAGAAAPKRQQQLAATPAQPIVRDALRVLGAIRQRQTVPAAEALLLDRAGAALAQAAVQQPGSYLKALSQLRQLVADVRASRVPCSECLPAVERALTALLPTPAPAPVRTPGPDRLARRYFQELSR
ncbi:DUF4175 family protein [Hymenobacter cavernae]|uniref:DUF4175 family protein n=1 Tax=Hymenobacter cavernae TaxID=2044852 RepID=A0ABQ1TZ74_9BACT|nr:DUF4175 family protein [Hymenobacter cavernae]GGF05021.1 hypothetical protein GCM10011383_15200 [Hymenobacter cavernae]